MKKKLISQILILLLAFNLWSCASSKKEEKTAITEYNLAFTMLKDKNYTEAAEKFEAIYDDYPLSKWSIKAQSMAAYAYFADEKFEDVIRVAEAFSSLNPGSEYIPYMHYMKSLSYFNLIPNVDRGQNYTKMASSNFRELTARFPDSEYFDDAKEKIQIIDERLAAAEMDVGRYQMVNQNYIGAIMHFDAVVNEYRNTDQATEAYFRLYEIYHKLGMDKQAKISQNQLAAFDKNEDWNIKPTSTLATK